MTGAGGEARDLTLPAGGGVLNVRVGAIIRRGGAVLMVGGDALDYYYSVGGRIRFGETAEQAVLREVEEETGVRLEIDRLGFIHEDFFTGDLGEFSGRPVHEIGFYFYMKVPEDFEPVCGSMAVDGSAEHLIWVPLDAEKTIYPTFFRTDLDRPAPGVVHIVTDER